MSEQPAQSGERTGPVECDGCGQEFETYGKLNGHFCHPGLKA